jgi:hypothetical protein
MKEAIKSYDSDSSSNSSSSDIEESNYGCNDTPKKVVHYSYGKHTGKVTKTKKVKQVSNRTLPPILVEMNKINAAYRVELERKNPGRKISLKELLSDPELKRRRKAFQNSDKYQQLRAQTAIRKAKSQSAKKASKSKSKSRSKSYDTY